jgi:glutaminase
VTGERALDPTNVDEVLSVMTTCGMYDFAGEWVYSVGMPAKSGVAGGILAVLPGQLGIGIFSPPLDEHGNSVRGVATCRAMSDDLELHFLRAPRASLSTVRSRFTLRSLRSKRLRSEEETHSLSENGDQVVIFVLQGDLSFGEIEIVVRKVFQEPASARLMILDLTRVFDVDPPASRLLLQSLQRLRSQDRDLIFVGLNKQAALKRFLEESISGRWSSRLMHFDDLDGATEWAEDFLLGRREQNPDSEQELPLSKHEITEGLTEEELQRLSGFLERRELGMREMVVNPGSSAKELFLLVRGELSVLSASPTGELQRLSTISPGMCFEEVSIVEGAERTAFVRADRPATFWVLHRNDFASLSTTDPVLKIKLLENLLRASSRTIHRLGIDSVMSSL